MNFLKKVWNVFDLVTALVFLYMGGVIGFVWIVYADYGHDTVSAQPPQSKCRDGYVETTIDVSGRVCLSGYKP